MVGLQSHLYEVYVPGMHLEHLFVIVDVNVIVEVVGPVPWSVIGHIVVVIHTLLGIGRIAHFKGIMEKERREEG